MQILDYQSKLQNPIINSETKGFASKELLVNYLSNKIKTKIPVGLEYRPDLIAKQFLGDERLAWLITYVNNFTNGIKDYTPGRDIYIPNV